MKKVIKLIAIILMLIVVFGLSKTIVFAQEDITPPSIVTLSLNKTSLKVGETLMFDMEIEDDFSGGKNFYVQWQLKEDHTKSIGKQYDILRDVGKYEYSIPMNTIAGEWQAVYISIGDNADNNRFYYRGSSEELLSKLDFTIENTDQDTEAPIVSNVKKITTNVNAPGEVIIQYDVTDNKSGVNSAGITYYPSGDLSNSTTVPSEKISGNTYRASFIVDSKYKKFVFAYIQARDEAGNYKNFTYSDLGLTNELDIIPDNYIEDSTAPELISYEYDYNKLQIPDSLTVTMDIKEEESGFSSFFGRAYFKSDDGKYHKETVISSAVNNQGTVMTNKGSVRLDFGDEETFTGKIYLYKIELKDNVGNSSTYTVENGNLDKKEFSVSRIEKNYTLTTRTSKKDYIDEISKLQDGSTVLCHVERGNQIIEKELFDAIKGKDITITFMSIYKGSSEITSSGEISSATSTTGIQWIINGKDVVNETKDIDMTIKISKKKYSKYIIPGYEINRDFEMDFWNKIDFENTSQKEIQELDKELKKMQKNEIKKYFDSLKKDGYIIGNEVYDNSFKELEYGADCILAIIYGNDNTDYISIEFAENGILPCKTIIRMKSNYAMRALIGAKDLKVYYADDDNYELVQDSINMDDEKYYNFTVTHNSEFCLTNKNFEKLAKVDENEKANKVEQAAKNEKDDTPKTGNTCNIDPFIQIIIVLSLTGIILLTKQIKYEN